MHDCPAPAIWKPVMAGQKTVLSICRLAILEQISVQFHLVEIPQRLYIVRHCNPRTQKATGQITDFFKGDPVFAKTDFELVERGEEFI